MLFDLPYEYEDESSIDWSLICSICSNPYLEPIITSCRHIFCYDCIELWLEKNSTCPICRQNILEDQYFWLSDESILNPLQKLSVRCSSCQTKNILRLEINDHLAHHCPSIKESSNRKARTNRIDHTMRSSEPRARRTRQPSIFLSLEYRLRLYASEARIVLRDQNITDLDMHLVVKLAVREKRCELLDLGNNPIGYNGLSFIAESLRNNRTLKSLSLHGIALTEYGISTLVAVLSLNQSALTELDLDLTEMNDGLMKYLVQMLKHNTHLTTLRLAYNRISKTGVKMLTSTLIRHNRSLKSLILNHNPSIKDSSAKALIDLLKKNSTLRELDVKDCAFSEKSKIAIYQAATTKLNFRLVI